MSGYLKRAGERSGCEAPIMWADFNTENYHHAKTCNCSHGGMCFETGYAPKLTTNIRIKTLNYLPNTNGPEAYKFYEAKVKWYRDLPTIDKPHYGVGVQYLIKSHKVEGPNYPCSLCGDNIPYGKIHSIDDFVYLCPHCFEHFKSLPNGMIKKNIKDFLIGNVI